MCAGWKYVALTLGGGDNRIINMIDGTAGVDLHPHRIVNIPGAGIWVHLWSSRNVQRCCERRVIAAVGSSDEHVAATEAKNDLR